LRLKHSPDGIWREGGFRFELIEYLIPKSLSLVESNNNIKKKILDRLKSFDRKFNQIVNYNITIPDNTNYVYFSIHSQFFLLLFSSKILVLHLLDFYWVNMAKI
jgi:hypothetical protein